MKKPYLRPRKARPDAICRVTGNPRFCIACLGTRYAHQTKGTVCHYHRAIQHYLDTRAVNDENPFSLKHFAETADWSKIHDSCTPEITYLVKAMVRNSGGTTVV